MGVVNLDYYEMVLYTIGAPYSANALQALMEWQRFEGGDAVNNPLNTELVWNNPRSRNYNTAGVQSYATGASGIAATAATLLNGYYPDIVAALRTGRPVNEWNTAEIMAQLDKWGTHDFAAYLATLPQPQPQPTKGEPMHLFEMPGNTGIYILFEASGKYVGVGTPEDVNSWKASGATGPEPLSAIQHARLLAAFPTGQATAAAVVAAEPAAVEAAAEPAPPPVAAEVA